MWITLNLFISFLYITLQDKLYTMTLNRELSKKYKKLLMMMPTLDVTDAWGSNKGEVNIIGFRVYDESSASAMVPRRYEVDVEFTGQFRWSWSSVRNKNSIVRGNTEKHLRRYLLYLGIETRFGTPNFYNNATIKKVVLKKAPLPKTDLVVAE